LKPLRALGGGIAGTLCLTAGIAPANVGAQQPFQYVEASEGALDGEPGLNTKVWLTTPDSTMARTLTELTARTLPLTHLKLLARASVQQIPVSCYVAGVPLRDVLEGLTMFSALQWKRTGETGLELGISYTAPQTWGRRFRGVNQARVAYYGMRVIHVLEKQPAGVREPLKTGAVRMDSLPTEVQQAVQALVKARSEEGRRGNRPQLQWPVDPKNTEVRLSEAVYGGETEYDLRASPIKTDDPNNDYGMYVSFNASQAAEYQRDPHIDGDAPDHTDAIRRDRRLGTPVSLDLHGAPLSEALKAIFTTSHVPLLASGSEHPAHADIVCKRVPLSEALDRICDAYGYRWERLDTGIVTLLANRQ
jgi:hypothetical protein